MGVWLYILQQKLDIPNLYFTHERVCIERAGTLLAESDCVGLKLGEEPQTRRVRFRTIGDMTCTGAVVSEASNVEEIIQDIAGTYASERGTRADDQRYASAMEDRKREGYF